MCCVRLEGHVCVQVGHACKGVGLDRANGAPVHRRASHSAREAALPLVAGHVIGLATLRLGWQHVRRGSALEGGNGRGLLGIGLDQGSHVLCTKMAVDVSGLVSRLLQRR